jgi:hypothetical protein
LTGGGGGREHLHMAVAARKTQTPAAIEWLLTSREPAIRYLARRDVLGEAATPDAEELLSGSVVRGLLRGQKRDGGFGVHPYQKWGGAHWRLVSLVELGIPAGEPRARAAAETVLDWLTGDGHQRGIRVIDGLTRRCASQEGNALAVCSRLGMAADPRVELLARSLAEWQWPDGGWNCDKKATGRRSSFHESLPPMWGLHEYWVATGKRGRGRRRIARPSSSWSTGSSGRSRPASPSTRAGSWRTTRPSGTTTCSRCC